MDGLDAAMTQDKLDRSAASRNERRQSGEDQPYGVLWLSMNEALYPADHPYGHSVIGSHEDLQAATVEDVVRFFQTWYGPNNAGLVVAGDFDVEETRALIERLFGHLDPVPLPERATLWPLDRPVKPLVGHRPGAGALTAMVWHTPSTCPRAMPTWTSWWPSSARAAPAASTARSSRSRGWPWRPTPTR